MRYMEASLRRLSRNTQTISTYDARFFRFRVLQITQNVCTLQSARLLPGLSAEKQIR